jgi:hypothetical protein
MVDRIGVPLSRLKNGVGVTVDGGRGELEYNGELADS